MKTLLLKALTYLLIFSAVFFSAAKDRYFLPRAAVKASEDPGRIHETCAYFYSKYDAKFYYLIIDGELYRNEPFVPSEFPFFKKRGDFYRNINTDEKFCNKIKFIYADWLIWRRGYIYDVIK